MMKLVLRHANISEYFVMDPDSSQITIGVVIQQYFHNDGRPQLYSIAYISKRFTEMESRHSIQERLLSAKHALDRWRHIIERSQILSHTDHESLQTFHKECLTPCLVPRALDSKSPVLQHSGYHHLERSRGHD